MRTASLSWGGISWLLVLVGSVDAGVGTVTGGKGEATEGLGEGRG